MINNFFSNQLLFIIGFGLFLLSSFQSFIFTKPSLNLTVSEIIASDKRARYIFLVSMLFSVPLIFTSENSIPHIFPFQYTHCIGLLLIGIFPFYPHVSKDGLSDNSENISKNCSQNSSNNGSEENSIASTTNNFSTNSFKKISKKIHTIGALTFMFSQIMISILYIFNEGIFFVAYTIGILFLLVFNLKVRFKYLIVLEIFTVFAYPILMLMVI